MTELNVLLISQNLGYFFSFIFSLCSFVPIIINVYQFRGHCLLFTNGTFNEITGSFEPVWSNFSYCGCSIFISALISLISLIQFIRMLKLLYKKRDCTLVSSFWDTIITFVLVILILIDSIIISYGFSIWCKVVTKRYQSCEDAYMMKINGTDINPNNFFLQLGVLQFGIWASLVIWVLLLAFAYRKFSIFYQHFNMVLSMAKERKRYLE